MQPVDYPDPYERVGSALMVAALVIGPTAAVGMALLLLPRFDSPFPAFAFVTIFAAQLAGTSLIARQLILGARPFLERALTTPLFAAALAATAEFAYSRLPSGIDLLFGAAMTIPWLGIFGIYW